MQKFTFEFESGVSFTECFSNPGEEIDAVKYLLKAAHALGDNCHYTIIINDTRAAYIDAKGVISIEPIINY